MYCFKPKYKNAKGPNSLIVLVNFDNITLDNILKTADGVKIFLFVHIKRTLII